MKHFLVCLISKERKIVMGKTFKKIGKMVESEDSHKYYKFEKSRQAQESFKNIDKYLKLGLYDKIDDTDLHEDYQQNSGD